MNHFPVARTANVVEQNLDNETLIYDLTIDKAYMLNETSAFVWKQLDGQTSIADISRRLGAKFKQPANEDIVWLAIEQLKKDNLLAEAARLPTPFTGSTRREAIKRIGLATMIALPLVTGLTAPQAAHAASNAILIAACQPCSLANPRCASGKCAVRTRPTGVNGSYCSAASDTVITLLPGDAFGANSLQECNTQAANYCCAGNGATFNSKPGAINPCSCNA